MVTLAIYQGLWSKGNLSFGSHWLLMNTDFPLLGKKCFCIVLGSTAIWYSLRKFLSQQKTCCFFFCASQQGWCNLFVQQDEVQSIRWFQSSLFTEVYRGMCVGYMQILCHLTEGPWACWGDDGGVLEPIHCWYWRTTVLNTFYL